MSYEYNRGPTYTSPFDSNVDEINISRHSYLSKNVYCRLHVEMLKSWVMTEKKAVRYEVACLHCLHRLLLFIITHKSDADFLLFTDMGWQLARLRRYGFLLLPISRFYAFRPLHV